MTDISLTKPIEAHGETVSVLSFREPTGADIARCGVPFQVAGSGISSTRIDAEAVANYIVALAAIPRSSVDRLSAPDWTKAMGVVLGFFGDTETQPTS